MNPEPNIVPLSYEPSEMEIIRPYQRVDALALAIQACVANGWRVEAVTSSSAIMVSGHPVNHVLHAILTIFLCGLWVPFWIILAMTTHEQRMTITIDAYGRPIYSKPAISR